MQCGKKRIKRQEQKCVHVCVLSVKDFFTVCFGLVSWLDRRFSWMRFSVGHEIHEPVCHHSSQPRPFLHTPQSHTHTHWHRNVYTQRHFVFGLWTTQCHFLTEHMVNNHQQYDPLKMGSKMHSCDLHST